MQQFAAVTADVKETVYLAHSASAHTPIIGGLPPIAVMAIAAGNTRVRRAVARQA
jgi:hypothetical protein